MCAKLEEIFRNIKADPAGHDLFKSALQPLLSNESTSLKYLTSRFKIDFTPGFFKPLNDNPPRLLSSLHISCGLFSTMIRIEFCRGLFSALLFWHKNSNPPTNSRYFSLPQKLHS
jgi:hypothetical protein